MKKTHEENENASLMAEDMYRREVRQMGWLTDEDEAKWIVRLERGKLEQRKANPNQWYVSLARDARERLVERYQPMVMSFARRFAARSRVEYLDLVQEANLGVLHAIDAHEPGSEFPLHSFVAATIRGRMLDTMRENNGSIPVPARTYVFLQKMSRAQESLMQRVGRSPSLAEIAHEMSFPEQKVIEAYSWSQSRHMHSLEAMMTDDEGREIDEDRFTLVSVFDASATGEDEERTHELEDALHEAIETKLNGWHRDAVRLRHGLVEGESSRHTFPQIAAMLGKSAITVQATESTARKRLREVLEPVYEQSRGKLTA